MQDANPLSTLCDLTPMSDAPPCDIWEFRRIIDSLQYLYLTRPDVSFSINKLLHNMQATNEIHMKAAKRLFYFAISRRHLTMVFTPFL